MDKSEFYEILDISDPSEFTYYENMASLLEEDSHIDTELITELLGEISLEKFGESLESYMNELLNAIPDEETDFYITVENIKRTLLGALPDEDDIKDNELAEYADLINKFRKWYSVDTNVINLSDGSDSTVRDARYDLIAAKLLGTNASYDFRAAGEFDSEGYNVRVADMIGSAALYDGDEYDNAEETED